MTTKKCVLIMAGGTGGHVFPGLAVAHYFREQGVSVHWLGTQQGLESRLVPEAGFPFHLISINGLRGKGFKALLFAPFKIFSAIREACQIMRQTKPDLILGMGGFVSGPGGVAAWLMKLPLIIHEQNAKAGLTNRILSKLASKVLEGFPNVFKAQAKVIPVGNPVRLEIENLPGPEKRFSVPREPFRLLVLGGSLGAQALNKLVPEALSLLKENERPTVVHQTGEKHFESARNSYNNKELQVNLTPFIKDMADAYNWADVVLCRAGALTVAELCAAGLGAIFVPFPHAVDDHQTANADFMVKHKAAICVQQSDLTPERLADILKRVRVPTQRIAMAQSAYQLRQVKVAEKIYAICQEVWR